MKGKTLKIILVSFFTITILAVGGLYYYASTKISPEKIHALASEEIQKMFPKAKIILGKLDIGLGFKIHLNVEKLEIYIPKLNGKRVDLVKMNSFKVKIPILAVISGKGSIDVDLNSPSVNYYEFKKENNWTYAMGTKDKSSKKTGAISKEGSGSVTESSSSVAIPVALTRMKANFSVKDIVLNYQLKDKSNGKINISKFLIKNLNLNTPTIYEMNSKFEFNMGKKDRASFGFKATGETNLGSFIRDQKLTSKLAMTVSDISVSSVKGKIPDINSNISVELLKNGSIDGKLQVSITDKTNFSAGFRIIKERIEIDKIKANILLQEILNIVGFKEKSINFNKAKMTLGGNLRMNQGKINPGITFRLEPGIQFNINDIKGDVTASGSYKGSSYRLRGNSSVLGGQGQVDLSGIYNINTKKFDLKKFRPIAINAKIKNIKFSEKMIRATLYPKEEKGVKGPKGKSSGTPTKVAKKEEAFMPEVLLPPSRINLTWNKIGVGKEFFNGQGVFSIDPTRFITKSLNFSFSKGKGKIKHSSRFSKKSIISKLNFDLSNLDMNGLKVFLPSALKNISGKFSGKVIGGVNLYPSKTAYNLKVNVKAKNGRIEGLNISEHLKGLTSSIPMLKGKMDNKKIDGAFERLNLSGDFKDTLYVLKRFNFIGAGKTLDMNGKGKIFPEPTKKVSLLDMEVLDKTEKLSTHLKTHTGSSTLPVRMAGVGFSLSPDYQYTIKKIAKGAIKAKSGLVKAKAKSAIKKQLEKQLKGKAGGLLDNKNVKKLFKGFFGR